MLSRNCSCAEPGTHSQSCRITRSAVLPHGTSRHLPPRETGLDQLLDLGGVGDGQLTCPQQPLVELGCRGVEQPGQQVRHSVPLRDVAENLADGG
jgi:hypothetical protein